MTRPNPYERFEKIHKVSPDLVYLFHAIQYEKCGGKDTFPVADIVKGLATLSKNCGTLIGSLGEEYVITTGNDFDVHCFVLLSKLLRGAELAPWTRPIPGFSDGPGEAQTHELRELFSSILDGYGESVRLGELKERIDRMHNLLSSIDGIEGEDLGELDERQHCEPSFRLTE